LVTSTPKEFDTVCAQGAEPTVAEASAGVGCPPGTLIKPAMSATKAAGATHLGALRFCHDKIPGISAPHTEVKQSARSKKGEIDTICKSVKLTGTFRPVLDVHKQVFSKLAA
jgi:hypothetical protein